MSVGKIVGDRYKLIKQLGEGSTSKVFLADQCDKEGNKLENSKQYAVKVLPMSIVHQNLEQTKREIAILKALRHRNVVSLREVLQSSNNVYIVMEVVDAGSLLGAKLPLPEDSARRIFIQLMKGLQYVHTQGVAHRDLKPANIMLKTHGDGLVVKITDFGLANIQTEGSTLKTRCGTPHYVAPEIVDGKDYDGKSSDVWSCGVLLYFLLTGQVPFDDEGLKKYNFDGLWNKIRTGTFAVPENIDLSPGVRSLIDSILTVDPAQRATVADCLNHPWVQASDAFTSSTGSYCGDDSRKSMESEEVVEGEAIQAVGLEKTAVISGGAGGAVGVVPTGVDALETYALLKADSGAVLLKVSSTDGKSGVAFCLEGINSPFKDGIDLAMAKLGEAGFETKASIVVNGAAGNGGEGGNNSNVLQGSVNGAVNPIKVKEVKGVVGLSVEFHGLPTEDGNTENISSILVVVRCTAGENAFAVWMDYLEKRLAK